MTIDPNDQTSVRTAADRRRRTAAIGIAVLCAFAVIVGAVALYRAATSVPEPQSDTELIQERARAYGDAMAHFDASAIGAVMCAGLGPVVGASDGVPQPSIPNVGHSGKTVVDDVTVTGDTATVDASLDFGASSVPLRMSLRRESDGWCITDVG